MEKLYEFFRGTLRIAVTGAVPERLLNAMAAAGIEFWRADPGDGYEMKLCIYARDLAETEALALRAGCGVKALRRRGGRAITAMLRRRFVLFALLAAVAPALCASSLFIWDIDVSGNETVSKGEILRVLEDNGVYIGAYWPKLSPDLVRSAVLPHIPELSWMTVNVRSSRAEVIVRQRVYKPELVSENIPLDLVAGKTGVVTKMSVLQGAPAVEIGAAVTEGETTVSGAVPGIDGDLRTVHAMGEVTAYTAYEKTAVSPLTETAKTPTGRQSSRFALIIGENRINFYRSSGNNSAECDKIIKIYKFGVEGVFTLPIAVVRETFIPYETEPRPAAPEKRLEATLADNLKNTLAPGGTINFQNYSAARTDALVVVTLRAECLENIAVPRVMSPERLAEIERQNQSLQEGMNE